MAEKVVPQTSEEMMSGLKDIGEFGFIDRITHLGNIRQEGVVKGIGDDCAVISVGGPDLLLVTTDLFVERVHFLLNWADPEIIGSKVLTTNLSDIAACGGNPRDAFISIAVPAHVELDWLDRFYKGMADTARQFSVNLLGGDTTGSRRDFMVNVALTGLVPQNEVLFRQTAGPGDIIVLTGATGDSSAGLDILLTEPNLPNQISTPLIHAHMQPWAHVKQGRILAGSGACTAAIDVSDGLAADLGHICKDSGVGAIVYERALPISPFLRQAAELMNKDPLDWVLYGGEDYVLLAGIDRHKFDDVQARFDESHFQLHKIGEFVDAPGMQLRRSDNTGVTITPKGWDHFRKAL
jgi:thiamine-monophosphate kinase